jgi:7,8-dihydroneopterin aldolase/epimerase/oxygenase
MPKDISGALNPDLNIPGVQDHLYNFLMVTVHLHEIIVFARHGVYEQERVTGNQFEIDLDVKFNSKKNKFLQLSDTVDYEKLFSIVSQCMETPTPLLENVCDTIIGKIKDKFAFISAVRISIFKLAAPIENFNGKAGVTISKKW